MAPDTWGGRGNTSLAMICGDTISAISSAVGPAARIIVRTSGPASREIGRALTGRVLPAGAHRLHLSFADLRVFAWVYAFLSPHSYSGEDMLELHIPGNPLLARMLLDELVRLGARPAEAGEFTARAYFNGKIDLTEAEGVAATIGARSERELAAARQLSGGELARRLRPMLDDLADLLALVEAGIDFSEEDITFISPEQMRARIEAASASLADLVAQSARLERLSHEPQVVLAGRPNAGKSTLLNALAGAERAVVSPTPGTTRDLIWAEVTLGRGMVRVIDAAGLDDTQPDPADLSPHATIARQMRDRALQAVESADVLLYLCEAGDDRPMLALPRTPDLVLTTKTDVPSLRGLPRNVWFGVQASACPLQSGLKAELRTRPDSSEYLGMTGAVESLAVSARTGQDMDLLRSRIESLAFGQETGASLALNARHLQAIDEARAALTRAGLAPGVELAAMELREALDALGRILGQITPDDVIGRVFARFCVGK